MISEDVIVAVTEGKLQGSQNKTASGFVFYSFQGIPYAKPPIGDLRFKAPQLPDRWSGIRDARVAGKACCQVNMFSNIYQGDEDCLYLNVYAPKRPSVKKGKMPVIFSIHGGGFIMGSGSSELYGPDYLVEQDVVLVTFNYRVGALGFLSLNNKHVPGNAGLKDQITALRWVHENISAFGGDPDNVTIYGQSAGGTSVHYLLLNENVKGLFHRAITSSGSVFSEWALQRAPISNALKLCSVLGHPTNDVDEAFTILKSVSAKSIVMAHEQTMIPDKYSNFSCIFYPVIEEVFSNEEAVITEGSLAKMKEGRFNHVPFMCGFNTAEGMLTLRNNKIDKNLCQKLEDNFEKHIDTNGLEGYDLTDISKKIKEFYFGSLLVTVPTIRRFINLKTDVLALYGINKTVQLHSKASNSPVYYYMFSFDIKGVFKSFLGFDLLGVCHGDDLGYLFKVKGYSANDPAIVKTRQRMVKMWTDFAKTGSPTPSRSELIPVLWEPATSEGLEYLDINSCLTMREKPERERVQFWEDIYRID